MNTLIIISLLGVVAMMADALRFKKHYCQLLLQGCLQDLDLQFHHGIQTCRITMKWCCLIITRWLLHH